MSLPATGATTRTGYVAESTIGTTPATPAFTTLKITSFNLNRTAELIRSQYLGDRNPKCLAHGNVSVSGDVVQPLIFGASDDFLQAALGGTWTTDVLQNGDVRRAFTMLREQQNFTGADKFLFYTGCEINTMGLSVAQNSDVTATFGVIGVEQTDTHEAITGQTFVAAPTECPFRYDRGSISADGETLADVTAFELNVTNNIESSYVLFSKVTGSKPNGEFNVTGNLTMQFRDFDLYDKYRRAEKVEIDLVLEDSAGNSYEISLPSALLNSGTADVGGPGEIPISFDFECDKSEDSDYTMQVTRVAAAAP